jgi:signal transduction histidine kinase
MMAEGLKNRPVTIAFEAGQGIPPIPHDAGRLRQVLINLVKNAAEAMPDGGEIRVGTDFADGYALVSVSDDGPGISPEVASRMFEPFCTTKESGTGLGLAACASASSRTTRARSATSRPGRGTTFTIRLPGVSHPSSAHTAHSADGFDHFPNPTVRKRLRRATPISRPGVVFITVD